MSGCVPYTLRYYYKRQLAMKASIGYFALMFIAECLCVSGIVYSGEPFTLKKLKPSQPSSSIEKYQIIPRLNIKDKYTGNMPVFKPSPNIDFKILQAQVDPGIDYKILKIKHEIETPAPDRMFNKYYPPKKLYRLHIKDNKIEFPHFPARPLPFRFPHGK